MAATVVSLGTLTKHVKERTRQNSRKAIEITPRPGTTELIQIHEDYPGEVDEHVPLNKLKINCDVGGPIFYDEHIAEYVEE